MNSTMTPLTLDGGSLDFSALIRIGQGRVPLAADEAARVRVRRGRTELEAAIAAGVPVYGATTGVGALKDMTLEAADFDGFNAGLVHAHHFGTGAPFPDKVVRAAIAIRVNTALCGRIGCTETLLDALIALLNKGVVPVVRRTGSIGCADIGLMGQIGAVLTGVGEAIYAGRRLPAAVALAEAGLSPLRMVIKDSLTSISSNAVGHAAAAFALRQAAEAIRMLLASGATAACAMGASCDPWEAAAHVGTAGEAAVGRWLHTVSRSSGIPIATHVQDPLSLRMMAQVYAVVFDTLASAGRTTLAATGRSDDNPIIVDGRVLTSGGSLPLDVAIAMQANSLVFAHAARNTFNRCVLIGNGRRRELPLNLVPRHTVATGFGPVVKLAGELFARVLSLTHPISAQSLVVADGLEDEAAFLPLIVERFERQIAAVRRLAALEALLAAQAIDLMGDRPAGMVAMIHGVVREHAAFYDVDRPLSAEVEAIEAALSSHAVLKRLLAGGPMSDIDNFFALEHPV
ncbi:MAG: aromatic amino acid lyase [Azospirillaceae bacterium]|nr:aromatic amino acid lyase [Azospirillaceae bacterium]